MGYIPENIMFTILHNFSNILLAYVVDNDK